MCNCVEKIKEQLIAAKVNTSIDFVNINLFTEQPVLTYEYKKRRESQKISWARCVYLLPVLREEI